jgi:hypothetical protein
MKAEIGMIRRVHSYVIAATVWSIPGINITVKGVKTYMLMDSARNHDGLWNHSEAYT